MSSPLPCDFLNSDSQPQWTITFIRQQFSNDSWAKCHSFIEQLNLNISGGRILDDQVHFAYEFYLHGSISDIKAIRDLLKDFSSSINSDLCLKTYSPKPKVYKLAVFDMDSTLIQCEVIDELAKRAGIGEQVASITASAMRGEIDFKESFAQRLGLIKGLSEKVLKSIAADLPMTAGVEYLIKALRGLGIKNAVFSGGFQYFADHLKEKLSLDYAHANTLEIIEGEVTGKPYGTIVDADQKAVLLKEKAEENNIALEDCICVGDGANDLKMIALAGLGVAFHAKPLVRKEAPFAISCIGLDGLLYLMGYSRSECDQALSNLPQSINI